MENGNDKPRAVDFSVLDGVGSKTAKALLAAGVTTMEQLAAGRVADLVDRLEKVGASVPASRIISERWLFQAWERSTGRPGDTSMPSTAQPSSGDDTATENGSDE